MPGFAALSRRRLAADRPRGSRGGAVAAARIVRAALAAAPRPGARIVCEIWIGRNARRGPSDPAAPSHDAAVSHGPAAVLRSHRAGSGARAAAAGRARAKNGLMSFWPYLADAATR